MMMIPFMNLEKKKKKKKKKNLEGVSQSVQIEINETTESAGALNAYAYYTQDAQLQIEKRTIA